MQRIMEKMMFLEAMRKKQDEKLQNIEKAERHPHVINNNVLGSTLIKPLRFNGNQSLKCQRTGITQKNN